MYYSARVHALSCRMRKSPNTRLQNKHLAESAIVKVYRLRVSSVARSRSEFSCKHPYFPLLAFSYALLKIPVPTLHAKLDLPG
jgi:hypothetical protein